MNFIPTNDTDDDDEKTEIIINDFRLYEQSIKENIEYDFLIRKYDAELVRELVACILDVVCAQDETVKIGREKKSRDMVRSVYLKLTSEDIGHVIERYESVRHKVTRLHSYLKTMLFTVKQEYGHFYANAVRADGVV